MPAWPQGPKRLLDPDLRNPFVSLNGQPLPGSVCLAPAIDHPNITIGKHAHASDFDPPADWAARLAPYLYPGAPEQLTIGRVAQIAHGVRFMTASANHPMRGLSTCPFRLHDMATVGPYVDEASTHGDTIIGADVWLGFEARVLPGVTIGAGAIVAACAVVAQDVPPYAVVAGNPARIVRMRLDDAWIARMLRLNWWDWPDNAIASCLPAIESADISALEAAAP